MSRETIGDVLAFLGDLGGQDARPHRRRAGAATRISASWSSARASSACTSSTAATSPSSRSPARRTWRVPRRTVKSRSSPRCRATREELVDRQRGKGVYEKSIRALQRLNALGYGRAGGALALNLVYNPQGPSLPPDAGGARGRLQARPRRAATASSSTACYTLANMPIQRFGSTLVSKGQFDEYMALLHGAHRAENLDAVMCRTLLSVDWQGYALRLRLQPDARPAARA